MTHGKIMLMLREIEGELNAMAESDGQMGVGDIAHLVNARTEMGRLIEQMLADEAKAKAAHTMGDLPFDGQKVKP